MRKWKSLGLLFVPDGNKEWNVSHAMMPCILERSEGRYDVYYSPRNKNNRSQGSKFSMTHLDDDNFEISRSSQEPILTLGPEGNYDDAGVMPTSLVKSDDKILMYYNGWTLKGEYPFTSFNGVAISTDSGDTFKKSSDIPTILYANESDPISTFAPFVIKENDHWKMWYVSCRKWESTDNGMKHYYHIRYAYSSDGLNWIRNGDVCIDFKNQYEYAIARPCVVKIEHLYYMIFSFRASADHALYQMGLAVSEDGITWNRMDDEFDFQPSGQSWDSEMQCYGALFKCNNEWYMLYNGNDYGKTGIGLAKCIQ